ncbi:MAG: sporulation protein [Clostridia bacterium]|jgi:sporulation protein YqfC|nr:sporulation protein [Clostridia bacterium]
MGRSQKKKENSGKLTRLVSQGLELPLDALTLLPRIECIGDREVSVEGHRGILEYGETRVRLSGGSFVLVIEGRGLKLSGMTPTKAGISGSIQKLVFER